MIRKRPYDIFISYRHGRLSDSEAGRLNERLKNLYNVCFDLEDIPDGDLPDCLYEGIEECTDFIVIVEKGTFDRTIDSSNEKEDWVGLEIEHALKCKKNVIPILLPDAEFPPNLPPNIYPIINKRGPEYSGGSYYSNFIDRLVNDFCKSNQRYIIKQYPIVRNEKKVAEDKEDVIRSFSPIEILKLFFMSLKGAKS